MKKIVEDIKNKIMMNKLKKEDGRKNSVDKIDKNVEYNEVKLKKEDTDKKYEFCIGTKKGEECIVNIKSDIIDVEVGATNGKDIKVFIENPKSLKNIDEFEFKVGKANGIVSVILKSPEGENFGDSFNIGKNGNSICIGNGNIIIQNRVVFNGNGVQYGRNNCSSSIQSSNSIKLVVLLPSSIKCLDLTATSVVSDVNIENILIENDIEVSSTSGEICLNDVKSKNVDVKSTSGDMLLRLLECDDVSVSSSSGDIEMSSSRIECFNAKTMSGDIKVYKDCGKEIKLKTMSGDIDTESVECEDVDLSTMSGDICLNNKTRLNYEIKKLKASTMSGDKDIIANYVY